MLASPSTPKPTAPRTEDERGSPPIHFETPKGDSINVRIEKGRDGVLIEIDAKDAQTIDSLDISLRQKDTDTTKPAQYTYLEGYGQHIVTIPIPPEPPVSLRITAGDINNISVNLPPAEVTKLDIESTAADARIRINGERTHIGSLKAPPKCKTLFLSHVIVDEARVPVGSIEFTTSHPLSYHPTDTVIVRPRTHEPGTQKKDFMLLSIIPGLVVAQLAGSFLVATNRPAHLIFTDTDSLGITPNDTPRVFLPVDAQKGLEQVQVSSARWVEVTLPNGEVSVRQMRLRGSSVTLEANHGSIERLEVTITDSDGDFTARGKVTAQEIRVTTLNTRSAARHTHKLRPFS